MGTWPDLAVLFDQVGKRLLDKGLKLAAFVVREGADGGQNAGIDLRCEFFTGHNTPPFYSSSVS
jgi:hypothetical protein